MSITQRLKELRESRSLSQSDLAELTGIPQTTISNYERGTQVTAENLIKLAQTLQVTSDYILGIEDNAALVDVSISHAEKRLIAAIRRGDKIRAIAMIVNGDE